MERFSNNKSLAFRAPGATVLCIEVAIELEMDLNNEDNFSIKFWIIFLHFKDPITLAESRKLLSCSRVTRTCFNSSHNLLLLEECCH